MNVVLSVYSEHAYKEFVLPPARNVETSLAIRREVFGLPRDLSLALENTDGVWSFMEQEDLALRCGGDDAVGMALENGQYISCALQGRPALAILVSVSDKRFRSYEKYALPGGSVTVGTAPDCGLQYSFSRQGRQYISERRLRQRPPDSRRGRPALRGPGGHLGPEHGGPGGHPGRPAP